MKNTTQALTVATLAALAVAVTGGIGNADSAVPQSLSGAGTVSVPIAPGVTFTGSPADNSSTLAGPSGSVTTRDGRVDVRDADRRSVLGTPIEPVAGGAEAAETTVASAPAPGAGDFLGDLTQAWHAAGPYTGLAAGVGGTAGALAGAVVGCPLGAITLGSMVTVMSASVLTVPGVVGGCLAGAGTGAAFGGMVGSVAVGLPVGLAVTAQKFEAIQAGHTSETARP